MILHILLSSVLTLSQMFPKVLELRGVFYLRFSAFNLVTYLFNVWRNMANARWYIR